MCFHVQRHCYDSKNSRLHYCNGKRFGFEVTREVCNRQDAPSKAARHGISVTIFVFLFVFLRACRLPLFPSAAVNGIPIRPCFANKTSDR